MSLNKTHGVGGIKEMTLTGELAFILPEVCRGSCMAGAVGSGGINLDGLMGLG